MHRQDRFRSCRTNTELLKVDADFSESSGNDGWWAGLEPGAGTFSVKRLLPSRRSQSGLIWELPQIVQGKFRIHPAAELRCEKALASRLEVVEGLAAERFIIAGLKEVLELPCLVVP